MENETKKLIQITVLMFFLNKILILLPTIYVHRNSMDNYTFLSKVNQILFQNFSRWDSNWYLTIINEGYNWKATAFFPLYPMLVRILSFNVIEPLIVGIVISNVCFVLLIYFFMKLVRLDYSLKETYKITLLLVLFPTSYYFSSFYTESLFMLFSVLFLYYLRKGNWQVAPIFGMFAGGTRNTGVLLTIPFVIEYLLNHIKQHKRFVWNKRLLGILWGTFIPLITILYMSYLWGRFGDPFAFSRVQELFGRGFMVPWKTIAHGYAFNMLSVKKILLGSRVYFDIYNVIELIFISLLLITLLLSFKRIRISYWIIILYSLIIPLTAPAYENVKDYFVSISRYTLVIVPLYIALYEVFRRKALYFFLVLSFGSLLVLLVYFWSQHLWVA
ncbi:mannosyltransferase family protein [Fredinandcohnia onubensis]|uniref:mannosyltransferase family protein n=1 Tax=Fredinandcohnia onubensis TaxID=1571209 RepID=UPI0015D51C31|nr:mannosyltransferase family protein [Fredinandcohnia onubensis]